MKDRRQISVGHCVHPYPIDLSAHWTERAEAIDNSYPSGTRS
jgi:hypothetical protein